MLALLLVLASGAADPPPVVDPARLAPGFRELDDHLRRTRNLVERAEALQTAVARIHNHHAERRATGHSPSCEDREALSVLARAPHFLSAWRDTAQSARVAADTLREVAGASTLAPVLDETTQDRVEDLLERAGSVARACHEALAWHRRYAALYLLACEPDPEPGPGLGRPAEGPVAVMGLGEGLLCPGDRPAGGQVQVLPEAEACYGVEACACLPDPVAPGAVLGPPDPSFEP